MIENIDKVILRVLEESEKLSNYAAYNGSMNDGGAGILAQQVEFYEHGRKGTIPPQWKKYANEFDPEYREYLRLKKKFNGGSI